MSVRVLFLFCSIFVFSFAGCSFSEKNITIITENGSVEFTAEIAETSQQIQKGLMFRTSMGISHGMLFLFSEDKIQNFWMKNTLIPLDMIFFDKNGKIVEVVKNALPCKRDPCPVYSSTFPVRYVLEINGGQIDRLGIQKGQFVRIAK